MIKNQQFFNSPGEPDWKSSLDVLSNVLSAHVGLVEKMEDRIDWFYKHKNGSSTGEDHQILKEIEPHLKLSNKQEWFKIKSSSIVSHCLVSPLKVINRNPIFLCIQTSGFVPHESYKQTLIRQTIKIIENDLYLNNEDFSQKSISSYCKSNEPINDYNSRVGIQKALEERNAQLLTLFNSTPDFICFKDGEGRWMEANQSLISLFGLEGYDYRGKNYLDLSLLIPNRSKELKFCHETDNLAWKSRRPINVEEHFLQSDGVRKVFDVIKAPLFNVDGSRKGLVILGRDITGRKLAEQENLENEMRFKLVAMHTNDVIFEWNNSNNSFIWNGNIDSILGSIKSPTSLRSLFRMIHPDDRSRMIETWRLQSDQLNKIWKNEFRLLLPDDNIIYLLGSGIVEKRENGEQIRAYGTITNITREKELVHTLREALNVAESNHAKLRGLLAIIPDIIFVFNGDGYFIDYHVHDEMSLLVSPASFMDKHVSEVLPPELATLTIENINKAITGKGVETYNYTIREEETEMVYESRMIYFQENETICIVRDVTHQKQIEKELLLAKEKAEESDRLKSAFLANMSHEIRTPMNGIMGFAELLKQREVSEDKRESYLDIIIRSGLQLLGLINDVLEISRIETGSAVLNREHIDLAELMSSLTAFFEVPANDKNIILKATIPPKKEVIINGDLPKLTQVFNNLIANAIKFTPENGTIEFGYHLNENKVEFFVEDSGIGIDPKHHQSIFNRFNQVYEKSGKDYGGAGLGLSICKSLVELMGGEIRVASFPKKGSRFTFEIPL
ncbi:PAS domain-containing protein [Natronoflexus pectinivorans]|uniref:histidine kinase n=1 Tax=Natronoflexus pectinivorans TaxID=682526 RepID=A0A4R2GID2_9BACT|nr:PAS domain-containing protein [Natronoflexus pectinivorans]TCO08317.1 PAS domain S-box-containing protein [Natronoflexus pectinivorans]